MRSFLNTAAALSFALFLATGTLVGPPSVAGGPFARSGADTPASAGVPERPRVTVDTADVVQRGRRIRVPAGGSLQKAIDEAKPGDAIALEAGAIYKGPFHLPRKEGEGWILISSVSPDTRLPSFGERVNPSHARAMARLMASSGSVVVADPGAHHYRFVGVEISPARDVFLHALVQLGDGDESDADDLPHHVILDRCYLHGDPARGTRRGVAMNARHIAVVNSYLSDFKEVGADSQAIAGWNGPGPFKIANNYLEAAGENVMFGGADPSIRGLVPADVEVLRNHVAKPLRWKAGARGFDGVAWAVKNLFELKNARRVLVDGNLFEYNWPHAQNGFAILFTVRNQEGSAPWSVVEDVTFVNNLVRHVGAGINILGQDDNYPSQQTRRITIRNNVFLDVGGSWGMGRLFQLLDGTSHITIDHNTALQTGSMLFGGDHAPHTNPVFQNNIAAHNQHGIIGSGTREGTDTLDRYFPGSIVRRNLVIGGKAAHYPPDNFVAASLDEVGFRNGNYRLPLARQYRQAGTDGRDPGADFDAMTKSLNAMTLWTEQGAARIFAAQIIAIPLDWSPEIIFWAAFVLLGYVYLGYPLVAWFRARMRPQPRRPARFTPSVSIVIVAHNEAQCIGPRIVNLLALNYPRDRLEILIGSDGSTDDTIARAQRYEAFGVTVSAFRKRRGKPAVLNDLIPRARGEIVVFADARQQFDVDALRALVANFSDPSVGAVSGALVLSTDRSVAAVGGGMSFYWRYEKFIRFNESRTNSTVGATGAIYGVRRALVEPIPDDTILDDVLIPLRVVRRGYRVLFEPRARAYDRVSPTTRSEWVRKVRTIAGNFQLFAREPWLWNPTQNPLWFETISHKALRLGIPIFHGTMLAANFALIGNSLYEWTLAGQLCFYAAALVGHLQRRARRRPFLLTVPYTMCLLIWATVVGFIRCVTQRQKVTWEKATPTRAVPT